MYVLFKWILTGSIYSVFCVNEFKSIFSQTNNSHRNMDFQKYECSIKKKKNPLRKVNSSFKKYDRYLFENMTVGNK